MLLTDSAGQPVTSATRVLVDAEMPAHGHGMETKPQQVLPDGCAEGTPCQHPGGLYTTAGMKLHMPGTWQITVSVDGPAGPDSLSFPYEMF